jgi:hypothetical protein
MITLIERQIMMDERHAHAKPYRGMEWMVEKASLQGETILDPFCGVGTILLAAKNLGRKAIGVEIDKQYCDVAVDLLKHEMGHYRGRAMVGIRYPTYLYECTELFDEPCGWTAPDGTRCGLEYGHELPHKFTIAPPDEHFEEESN